MDVGSNNSYPAGKLSNFTGFAFEVDGIKCASMEGFLQSLKFENINSQEITCQYIGLSAKFKGKKRNKRWKSMQTLWWRGISYKRDSEEYQQLLDKAYTCLYEQNENFRHALKAAGEKTVFTHSIGNNDSKETVLTEREFCSRLQRLKDFGNLVSLRAAKPNTSS